MENMEQQSPVEAPQAAPQSGTDLTLNDLANLRQIIDIAVRRGTFNASEISGVGAAYDRLNNFLTALANQQKTEAK